MRLTGIRLGTIFAAFVAGCLLIPEIALAQTPVAGGLGQAMLNAGSTGVSVRSLLSIISYVLGAGLGAWGLVRLKAWGDGQVNFGDGLLRLMGGAFLMGLPSIIQSLENSIFGGTWSAGSSQSGGSTRTSGLTHTAKVTTLDQAMENLVVDIYDPAKQLTAWAAWIIGLVCVATGVYRLAQSGQAAQGRSPSGKGTAGYILGGALMLAAGNIMDTIGTTLFGKALTTSFTSLSYGVPGQTNQLAVNHVIQALFAFVEIIGWIAFVRGLYLLVKLAQGGADKSHAHAFSHIVFGAAAVNMYAVVQIIQQSLGVTIV